MRIEKLLALGAEFYSLCFHLGSFADGSFPQSVEVLQDEVLYVVAQLGRESDGLVLVLDQFFNQLGRHRLALAVRDLARPARTNEVKVLSAPAVAGRGCHEPGATRSAVDAAAQVMAVGSLARSGGGVCRQQVLHLLPGARVDERFVNSRIDRSSVMNLPFVVGVAEKLVQCRYRQWLAWPLGSGAGAKPARRQLVQQRAQRGIAFGVAIEGPRHQMLSIGINVHAPIHAPQFVGDMDVLVAKRCT